MQQTLNLLSQFLRIFLCAALLFVPFNQNIYAQSRAVRVIRDAEIEQLLTDYASPLLRAAGFNTRNIQIIIVNDRSFNAFVDGQRIFVNSGTIMEAETPNEVIGVLAHEIGHLAGRHQQRLREMLKNAQTIAIVGMLLGIGSAAAGAATGNGSAAGAGGGLAASSSEIAMRSVLSYRRSEESSADRSAIKFLNATHQSASGMLKTFERFSQALSLSGANVDPYRISHPLPQERIAALKTLAHQSPYFEKKDPPSLQMRHNMARAKIAAYYGAFADLRRMFKTDPRGLPARYGEAVLAVEKGTPSAAMSKVTALVKEQPKNPFFHELLGDLYIKANNPAAAAAAYQRAKQLDSRQSSLLGISYGHALILTDDPKNLNLAIKEIRAGLAKEPDFAAGYAYLAMAYSRAGELALGYLATADMNYYSGNIMQAHIFATRAQKGLKKGSADWLRAQDLLNTTRADNDL